ncbi:MAG: hypothetical protein IJ523_09625 [Succinivibrionaceae bacterium]|nr:hypothetical protein [Succinivibrionaceae bacterium]
MRISSIWSGFSSRDAEQKFYRNPKFKYQVSFETSGWNIIVKYYKSAENGPVEVKKDDIPQAVFSAMLQSEDWETA